jgi:hypothetical protein
MKYVILGWGKILWYFDNSLGWSLDLTLYIGKLKNKLQGQASRSKIKVKGQISESNQT